MAFEYSVNYVLDAVFMQHSIFAKEKNEEKKKTTAKDEIKLLLNSMCVMDRMHGYTIKRITHAVLH